MCVVLLTQGKNNLSWKDIDEEFFHFFFPFLIATFVVFLVLYYLVLAPLPFLHVHHHHIIFLLFMKNTLFYRLFYNFHSYQYLQVMTTPTMLLH
jgi:hypothetical protein